MKKKPSNRREYGRMEFSLYTTVTVREDFSSNDVLAHGHQGREDKPLGNRKRTRQAETGKAKGLRNRRAWPEQDEHSRPVAAEVLVAGTLAEPLPSSPVALSCLVQNHSSLGQPHPKTGR